MGTKVYYGGGGSGEGLIMFERLLAAVIIILIIGLLTWNAMVLKAENITLKRENNHLELKIAQIHRAEPWIKILNESLTELEKDELDLKAEQLKQRRIK